MKYIREATKEEISKMFEHLRINLYNEFYWSFFGTDYYNMSENTNDGYGNKLMAIIDDSNECVGLVQISRKVPRSNAVLGFVVYEYVSGRGYGPSSIKETLDLCKSIGINNILIDTTSERLKTYYEGFGFEHVGTFKKWGPLPDGKLHDKNYLQIHL